MNQDKENSKKQLTSEVKEATPEAGKINIIDPTIKIRNFISKYVENEKLVNFLTKTVACVDYSIDYIVEPDSTKYERDPILQIARGPIKFGIWVLIIMFGFFGGWATFLPLDTASHCPGVVVVSSNKKVIQHLEGGIIKEIYVKNGDLVEANQPLLLLKSSRVDANYEFSSYQFLALKAKEARLKAQRDLLNEVNFPKEITEHLSDPKVKEIYDGQQKQFFSNMDVYKGKINLSTKKIEHSKKQIESLKSLEKAAKIQLGLYTERTHAAKQLADKGYQSKNTLAEQEARKAESEGKVGDFEGRILAEQQNIQSIEVDVLNFKNAFLGDISKELADTELQITESSAKTLTTGDEKDRLLITSPIKGIVHSFYYSNASGLNQNYTPGSVLPSGAQIMSIVPVNDELIVEARIKPQDIDAVTLGQIAKIKITAFKSRNTPDIIGTVSYISSDIVQDNSNKGMMGLEPYYAARIVIDKEQFKTVAKLKGKELQPGMQADISIISGSKTFLRYLLDPITDSFNKSFSER